MWDTASGIPVAYPQMGERKRSLAVGAQAPPAGAGRAAVLPQLLRDGAP